jgi:hypothetical protein
MMSVLIHRYLRNFINGRFVALLVSVIVVRGMMLRIGVKDQELISIKIKEEIP